MSRKTRTKSKTRNNAKSRAKKATVSTVKSTDTEETVIPTAEPAIIKEEVAQPEPKEEIKIETPVEENQVIEQPDLGPRRSVVHITSGVSGLVLALTLGKRRGYDQGVYHVHNTPFVFLGAALLWFGWYGFNAGSALAANGLAAHAFMTTCVSAAAALVSWMLIEVFSEGKTTLVGASTGLVIGLVAITPGAGFVPMWAAVICGLLVSPICYFGVKLIKGKLKIDDALDAFGCHGIGGIWGGIATGLFGMTSINGVAKWNGLVFGETRLFVAQIIGILVSIAVAVVGSLICIAIVRIFTPLRVEERAEKVGLDVSEHGENAYPSFNGLD